MLVEVIQRRAEDDLGVFLEDEKPDFCASFLFDAPIVVEQAKADTVFPARGLAMEGGALFRFDFGPASLARSSEVEVGNGHRRAGTLHPRRLVIVLARIVVARDDEPTARLHDAGDQPLAATPPLELVRFPKRGHYRMNPAVPNSVWKAAR